MNTSVSASGTGSRRDGRIIIASESESSLCKEPDT